MTPDAHVTTVASGCHLFSGCGYPSPGLDDFIFKPIFSIGPWHVTKPELLMVIVVVVVVGFFWAAFSKPKLVPRGVQNIGELGVMFVRDQILRPMIGKKGDGYLPFLCSLFFFIWLMNLLEIIPVAQFPVPARIGYAWILVALVWLTYMSVGFKIHGPIGFFGHMIPDAPWWILWLLAPIVLFSDILVRPFTLGIRLFANMFAGHLLLLVFYLATWYFVSAHVVGLLFAAGSLAMVIVLTAFELLIQFLQAFIFTILAAFYIGDAMEGI